MLRERASEGARRAEQALLQELQNELDGEHSGGVLVCGLASCAPRTAEELVSASLFVGVVDLDRHERAGRRSGVDSSSASSVFSRRTMICASVSGVGRHRPREALVVEELQQSREALVVARCEGWR